MKKVVVTGGAGDMARVAAGRLLEILPDVRLTLSDIDVDRARAVATSLGSHRVEETFVDIYDSDLLRGAVHGSDLVMNCTGPYYRTGRPVLEACVAERVDYIDLGDDEESASELLSMDREVRDSGIIALICCGIAPGLVNVLARFLAELFERAEAVDLAWVTGSTPRRDGLGGGGAAAIEHMLHSCMGTCITVREGRPLRIPSFLLGHELEFPRPLGRYRVFELGHAEVATIPRFMPGVKAVRTMGALYPRALNGFFRGLAKQVERGRLDMKSAVRFILELDAGERPKGARAYVGAAGGLLSQLRYGDLNVGELRDFLRTPSGAGESRGGILVAVEGLREGKRVRDTIAFAERQDADSMGMDEVTGTPLAVFASMILDGSVKGPGVLAPEACVEPDEFLKRLEVLIPAVGGMIDVKTGAIE